jgi:signal transduction histidine kinase
MENFKPENKAENELSLEKRLEISEAKNKEYEETIKIIGHDLKGPITAWSNIVNILIMRAEGGDSIDNKELVDILKEITKNSDNISKLLENILEWNKLKQEGKKPEMFVLDLSSEINNSTAVLSEIIKAKGVKLENQVSKDIKVLANSNMIQTVLRNLSSNAIKYTNEGGNIVISSEKSDDNIKILIKDDGVGINKEKLEKLFKNIVVSSEGTKGETGTGLGLLLCKENVEKMGGTISVESEEGKGTTFTISLPSGKEEF